MNPPKSPGSPMSLVMFKTNLSQYCLAGVSCVVQSSLLLTPGIHSGLQRSRPKNSLVSLVGMVQSSFDQAPVIFQKNLINICQILSNPSIGFILPDLMLTSSSLYNVYNFYNRPNYDICSQCVSGI